MHLHKNSALLGTFLALEANIDLDEDATLEGALYGQKVSIKKGARVTEDVALDLFISLFLP